MRRTINCLRWTSDTSISGSAETWAYNRSKLKAELQLNVFMVNFHSGYLLILACATGQHRQKSWHVLCDEGGTETSLLWQTVVSKCILQVKSDVRLKKKVSMSNDKMKNMIANMRRNEKIFFKDCRIKNSEKLFSMRISWSIKCAS